MAMQLYHMAHEKEQGFMDGNAVLSYLYCSILLCCPGPPARPARPLAAALPAEEGHRERVILARVHQLGHQQLEVLHSEVPEVVLRGERG